MKHLTLLVLLCCGCLAACAEGACEVSCRVREDNCYSDCEDKCSHTHNPECVRICENTCSSDYGYCVEACDDASP